MNAIVPTLVRSLPVHTHEMYGVFSPDGSCLLTGGDGAVPTIQIWDVETDACLHTLTGHTRPVSSLAWSDDQRQVASGGFDRCVRRWDANSGACLRVWDGHRSYVRSLEFDQSGNRLLAGSGDGLVRLGDVPTGTTVREFEGHTDGVYCAVFDTGEERILSGGRDRTIRLWEIETGRCERHFEAHGHHVQGLAWHADRRRFLSCADDIRLWDANTIRSVAWAPDGRQFVSASHDRTVRIWDSETGHCRHVLEGHEEGAVHAAWALDGASILSCDSGGGRKGSSPIVTPP